MTPRIYPCRQTRGLDKKMKNVTVALMTCLIILCGAVFAAPARAYELVGLPGSTWGQLTHDNGPLSGSGAMGNINQGIDWVKLPGDVTLDTYVEYRWRSRTRNKLYYDAQGPVVGVELKKSYFKLGADYYWERLVELHRTSYDREFYLTWYYWWDLKRADIAWLKGVYGLPGSTWGTLTYDVNGINGSGAMGYVNQGIDWIKLPGDVILNTFVELRHRSRTRNKPYYDAEGPAAGVEFKKSFLRAGADYYWERYPALHQSSERLEYYVSWYYYWDLLKK